MENKMSLVGKITDTILNTSQDYPLILWSFLVCVVIRLFVFYFHRHLRSFTRSSKSIERSYSQGLYDVNTSAPFVDNVRDFFKKSFALYYRSKDDDVLKFKDELSRFREQSQEEMSQHEKMLEGMQMVFGTKKLKNFHRPNLTIPDAGVLHIFGIYIRFFLNFLTRVERGTEQLIDDILKQINFENQHQKHDFSKIASNAIDDSVCYNTFFGRISFVVVDKLLHIVPQLLIFAGFLGTIFGVIGMGEAFKNPELFLGSFGFALESTAVGVVFAALFYVINAAFSTEEMYIDAQNSLGNAIGSFYNDCNEELFRIKEQDKEVNDLAQHG